MKKFLVVFFTVALFSVKASFAQFYQTDTGIVLDTSNSYENVTDSNFAWQFVPSDDGYILQAWFFGDVYSRPAYVSWSFTDQNNNVTWDNTGPVGGPDTPALVDFPGFVWSDYKQVQIEFTSYDDDGFYDDVNYVFNNTN